ncbi:MAG TPA: Tat pathway signal sequence domain protein, partial [Opitutaceae bacterium]|nr:Tat pathway signal sequence domain protein [Opitutaceae bacterium]
MCSLTRRDFVRKTALATAAVQLAAELKTADRSAPSAGGSAVLTGAIESRVHWLEGATTARHEGVTWGMPWRRGEQAAGSAFALMGEDGRSVPVQSWPLATWPDGSLKWTAHTMPPGVSGKTFLVQPGSVPAVPDKRLTTKETPTQIELDTGVIQIQIAKTG